MDKKKEKPSKPPSKRQIRRAEEESIKKKIKLMLFHHNREVFSRKSEKEQEKLKKKDKTPKQLSDEDAEEQVYDLFWKTSKKKPLTIKILKWTVIIALFFALAYYWTYVQSYILELLGKNQYVWMTYEHILWHITSKTLLGLFYFTFFANLFFLSLPDELIFLMYLGLGFPLWQVVAVALFANVLGMVVNYLIGCIISKKFVKKILKEKYTEYSIKMKHTGWLIIILGNLFPSPIQIISVMFGTMRYGFWKFLSYTLLGKIFKFSAMFYGYQYYTNMISPVIEKSVNPTASCMSECMGDLSISDIIVK